MIEQQANHVTPATEGEVSVTSVTAGSTSSAVAVGAITARYYRVVVDAGDAVPVAFYMTRKNGAAPTDPAPTATSGDGRTQAYEAAGHSVIFTPGDQIKVYVPGSGTHYLRLSPASPV
jgi:hypothetical protein